MLDMADEENIDFELGSYYYYHIIFLERRNVYTLACDIK